MSKGAYPDIGGRIRAARKAAGFTALGFAQRLGKHPSQISRWETGQIPSPVTLLTVARECGVTVDWIMSGDGDGPAADATT
jgi:transcriptional regulator with XRE-family HTH domain